MLTTTQRKRLKVLLAHLFHALQRFVWDVLPRHFYSEITDIQKLRVTHDWRKPFSMIGVSGSGLESQGAFVRNTMTHEVRALLAATQVHEWACREKG